MEIRICGRNDWKGQADTFVRNNEMLCVHDWGCMHLRIEIKVSYFKAWSSTTAKETTSNVSALSGHFTYVGGSVNPPGFWATDAPD